MSVEGGRNDTNDRKVPAIDADVTADDVFTPPEALAPESFADDRYRVPARRTVFIRQKPATAEQAHLEERRASRG